MPPGRAQPVVRTPQAERRARTRARLLDAALELLAEEGYARTTTTEIVRRAGVSRGAQVHHFPTKVELVAAATEVAMERRVREWADALSAQPPGPGRMVASIDLLWTMFQSPACEAWIELAIASRHDPELRARMVDVNEHHRAVVEQAFTDAFTRDETNAPLFDVAAKFLMALFDGLVIHRISGYDDAPGRAEAVVSAAKLMASIGFPGQ